MPGQQLNVAQGSAGFIDEAGRTSDEGAAAGMGRAAVQAQVAVSPIELNHDAQRSHWAAAF